MPLVSKNWKKYEASWLAPILDIIKISKGHNFLSKDVRRLFFMFEGIPHTKKEIVLSNLA